jgi:uncharacterized repeat protein (TIGR03803 family)
MRNLQMRSEGLLSVVALALTLTIILAVFGAHAAQAQTFTVLYSFKGGTDGDNPYAGVITDSAGNLYGTTVQGGTGRFDCAYGCGTVFKLDTAGNETVLHNFGETSADGQSPFFGYLFRDGAGNLYGTTTYGGADGSGTIFRVSSTGRESVVPFTGGANGGFPYAGLVADPAGNAYGTTYARGSGCPPYGCGTVFKVSSAGNVTVLYSFTGGVDGGYPWAGLVRDSADNLYGTTETGGANGAGTVFKVDPAGNESVLYSFCSLPNCADGDSSIAGLVRDNAGNLYGTTLLGGANGAGTVFKVNGAGQETVLYSFCPGGFPCEDGLNPWAGVVRDSVGNLYGTTLEGGAYGQGTVFEVNSTSQETVLYSFTGGADGCNPYAGVTRDSAGDLYGTTPYCGTGGGTVFKIAP